MILKSLMAMTVFALVLSVGQASASHDAIYSPCGTEYGFIHMTYDEWAAHITTMEANGTIPPGVVFRYNEELHGGKGLEDPRVVWARNLTDGQILSIDDWANGDYPEIEALMFSSGLIPEWILDANRTVRRFNDPYWAQANPLTPTWTVWQSLCMANYGYSLPAMEINEAGVWESNIPTTTTIDTVVPTTDPAGATSGSGTNQDALPPTTTQATSDSVPNEDTPVPTTTQAPSEPIPETGTPATTTTQAIAVAIPSEVTPESSPPALQATPSPLPAGYDLFTAQYEGWPFEQTLRLLEERYPQGTPGKYHFRLSYAVDFLRGGGLIGGLDAVWNAG
jgi:hypothetical protein